MTPGVHSMSREAYRKLPYLNQSLIKKWIELGDIPSEFKYWRDNPDPPSEAQILGEALDCSLLESDQFDKRFAIIPSDAPKKPTKSQLCAKKPSHETVAAIKYWDEFNASLNGRTILTQEDEHAVKQMWFSLLGNDSTKDVFKHCLKVVLIGWLWGLECKAEIDLWNDKSEHIIDLKTCKDVSPNAFARDFITYGYDKQAAFYLGLANELGFDKKVFDFITVRNAPPWTVQVYSFAPWDNEQHSRLYDQSTQALSRAAEELTERFRVNDFTDSKDWRAIELPRWAIKRELDYV